MKQTMKTGKKNAISLLFVLSMIALSIGLVFHHNDWQTVKATLAALHPLWMFAAMGCWLLHVMTDALILYLQLRKGQPIRYRYALYVTVMGSFYCAITPGSSGGQPMQAYYLSKKNVPLGLSASALSVKFAASQASTVLITSVLWLFCQPVFHGRMAELRWLIAIGWLVHLAGVALILMAVFFKETIHRVADVFIRWARKLHLLHEESMIPEKVHSAIESYHTNLNEAIRNPQRMLGQLMLSAISLFFIMLVPACIYQAFGLSGTAWQELLATAYMLYISASYNPLPGASGAQEGGFLLFYQGIFPPGVISMAMFVWRFFTYYLYLIAGAFVMLSHTLHHFISHSKQA